MKYCLTCRRFCRLIADEIRVHRQYLLVYFPWSQLKPARYLLESLHTVATSDALTRRAVVSLTAHRIEKSLKPPPGQLAPLLTAIPTTRGKGRPKPVLAAQHGRLTCGDDYTLNVCTLPVAALGLISVKMAPTKDYES
jgi:hypothetical protein